MAEAKRINSGEGKDISCYLVPARPKATFNPNARDIVCGISKGRCTG